MVRSDIAVSSGTESDSATYGEMPDNSQALSDSGQTARSAAEEAVIAQANERAREILDKVEAAAKDEAKKIVDDARAEAAAILDEAREQGEAERAKAAEEGFAQGIEDGKAKGYEDGLTRGAEEGRRDFDEKIQEDDEKLRNLIEGISEGVERTCSDLESGVSGLAMEIVRKVVDPGDAANGVFESMIRNAIRQIRTDRKITVRVGQEMLKRFFPSGSAEFRMDGGVTVKVTVLEDQTLGEGDVVIDAGEETINAGLETQLRNLEVAFERADV